jgi:hypothetical protein
LLPDKADILFLDDGRSVTQRELRTLLEPQGVTLRLLHPEDVEQEDLDRCDVVVIDYFLEDWQARNDTLSVARAPRDGLAVAATLRSRLLPPLDGRTPGATPARPVAFALWSANLGAATFALPTAVRAHVFARENNLEWAFDREDITSGKAIEQVADLAHAVRRLPEEWPGRSDGDAALQKLAGLLAMPDEAWAEHALEQVLGCHPQVFELSERSHGLVLLRWLLHRVLPYPTFLFDEDYLRARLRLDALPDDPAAPLWQALKPSAYRGILPRFGGRRWWRAGVEHWLWDATQGRSGDPAAVRRVAVELGGTASREWRQPVVVNGANLQRKPDLMEISDTVRLHPDDWPPYADHAYGARDEAREEPTLAAIVDPLDRHLLDVPPA